MMPPCRPRSPACHDIEPHPVAVVTGADRGLGLALSATLLDLGWQVVAGQYLPSWPELAELACRHPRTLAIVPMDVASDASVSAAAHAAATIVGHVDLLINNAGVNSPDPDRAIRAALDYREMSRLHEVNALGPLRVTEAFLPLLDRGTLRRLCFVSSEAASITAATRHAWFGYAMSKAALNMAVKLLHNSLRPEGYSFRLYHPGWIRSHIRGGNSPGYGELSPQSAAARAIQCFLQPGEDEDRLAMVDHRGHSWPW